MSCRVMQKGARKTGWLSKRGGRIHTWHRRWFILTGDLLFYYKTPQDSRPTGTIPLAGNRVIRHLDDSKNGTFKFEIVAGRGQQISSTHNTYLISAESAQEADSWVAAVRRVVNEPFGGGMFGRSLQETMQVETRLGGGYVPILLHRCTRFIHEHGLREVGIFRLPGQARRVQTLKELYDQGCQQEFSSSEDVHTVASLLKLYLRELPEPLIPYVYYDKFHMAMKMTENGVDSIVEELQRLLIHLPKVNFNIVKYLIRFLYNIQEHAEHNKMTALNLSTVFGPNFLRPQTSDPKLLMECNNISTDFVCVEIDQHWTLFPVTADEKPPRRLSIALLPEDSAGWCDKGNLIQRSLYITQESPPSAKHAIGRRRQNSAPYTAMGKEGQPSHGKVASMVEQFNLRTTKSASQLLSSVEISSPMMVRHTAGQHPSPLLSGVVISGPPTDQPLPPGDHSSANHEGASVPPVFVDTSSPETDKRASGLGKLRKHSDTLSSDVIVNSISREMESLEAQLSVVQEENLRYKKAARMWKSRYNQERTARLAAEERAHDLQRLVDETFQQFGLDDSEDDSFGNCSEPSDPGSTGESLGLINN